MRRRQADFKQYPPPLLGTLQSFSKVSPKVFDSCQNDLELICTNCKSKKVERLFIYGQSFLPEKKLRRPLYMAKQNFWKFRNQVDFKKIDTRSNWWVFRIFKF